MKKLSLKCTYRKKGYTLIELVISVAIILIISMVFTSILGISQKALNKTYLNENINSDISYTLEYIKNEIEKSEYYTRGNNDIYFIQTEGNKFNYIWFNLEQKQVYRNSSLVTKLKRFSSLKSEGKNSLTNLVDDFSITHDKNCFIVKLKFKEKEELTMKVAKRIKEL